MSVFFINPFLGAVGGDFESIATVTVGSGGAANIEFTSIPSTYQHLQLRIVGRGDRNDAVEGTRIQINGDTSTSSYTKHRLLGDGSSASAGGWATGTWAGAYLAIFTAATSTASVFGAQVVDILDYASTTKTKTLRSFGGYDANGSGQLSIESSLWNSTSAITSVKIIPHIGSNFVQHTTAALYGIKAP